MLKTEVFEQNANEYDAWFDQYKEVFESEVEALREMLPVGLIQGIEVGLGTGRFTTALGLKEGIEPADSLRQIAISRGVETMKATAENLPYSDMHFDFVLIASSISYFENALAALKEAYRVLKRGGSIIVGFIDKDSTIGQHYQNEKADSKFYKHATFYSVDKIQEMLTNAGFTDFKMVQTLFGNLDEIKKFQKTKPGSGEGSFVVIKGIKK